MFEFDNRYFFELTVFVNASDDIHVGDIGDKNAEVGITTFRFQHRFGKSSLMFIKQNEQNVMETTRASTCIDFEIDNVDVAKISVSC